jgi:hypothetical protein
MIFQIDDFEFWVPNNIYNTREAYSDHEYITFDSDRVEIRTEKFVGMLTLEIVPHMYLDTGLSLPNLECVKGEDLLEQLELDIHCWDHRGSSVIEPDNYYRLVKFDLGL